MISIIVPIYKVEKYLRKCVDSILAQTYKDIEAILVDDGSPDNCGKICDEYAKSDSRVRVIHKENGGLSDARNAGIDAAKGEYLAFIDSDDYLDTFFCEKMYQAITDSKSDIAICSLERVDENYQTYDILQIRNGILHSHEMFESSFLTSSIGYIIACNKLYKKCIFGEIRYPKGRIHEDEFVIHHIFHKANKIVCLDEPLYYYLKRDGSISSNHNNIKRLDAAEAFCDRMLFSVDNGFYCLAYSSLVSMASVLYDFKPYDELSKARKEYYKKIYVNFLRSLSLKDYSVKRRIVLFVSKFFPKFLYVIRKLKK